MSKKINIYCISLEHKAQDDFIKNLSQDELTRAFNFIQAKHQRRYIICQGLLRQILSQYLSIKPHEIKFRFGKYGKPYLAHDTNVTFNVSHSNEMALIAVSQSQEIGIDLEYRSERPIEGIAEKMFSQEEIARMHQATTDKIEVFYEIWSGKEAFIKAIGMGLRYPTQAITIPKLSFETQTIHNDNMSWYIRKLNLSNAFSNYSNAICFQYPISQLEIYNL